MSRGNWKLKGNRTLLGLHVDPLSNHRCQICRGLHCYWCGLGFKVGDIWLGPTRDHLYRKGERAENSHPIDMEIVNTHAWCNNRRGHMAWTPFHQEGTMAPTQIMALERLKGYLRDSFRAEEKWQKAVGLPRSVITEGRMIQQGTFFSANDSAEAAMAYARISGLVRYREEY